jgi:RNA-directed DNA polymerase
MNLQEQLCTWENIRLAYACASRGKRGRPSTAGFELYLGDNLVALQKELVEKTYQPGQYHSFYIHEPKRRLISAAPFRDRVAHHALCNLITPYFEKRFIANSFANREGKGTHRALNTCQQLARRYPYVLQCDVRQFFPSIDHAILRRELQKALPEASLFWLIDRILASGQGVLSEEYQMMYFPGDDLFAIQRPRGLPIGNLTSQWWANVYLNRFDNFIHHSVDCHAYLRYVDDFMLFGRHKAQLWEWRAAIVQYLAKLRLTIHEENCLPRPVTDGIPFLGFVVYPEHRLLKRRKGVAYARRLRQIVYSGDAGKVRASVQGWINHARYGDTYGLRKAVLARYGLLEGFDG